jgi:hypothetical protein
VPEGPPESATEAARAAGLRRLSRLTWRATQLSAVTAVGFATLFARTAPVQSTASDGTAPPAVSSSPAAPASAPGKAHRKRARTTASARARAAGQPVAASRVPSQASPTPTAAPSKSATLAPPSSAPAAPTSAAPTPKPTVSSASHGGG